MPEIDSGGSLFHWVRDAGALIGGVTGILAIFKAFFQDRPFSYLEPDTMKGVFKLYVFNPDKRSIVVVGSRIFPQGRWYVAPNARNVTDLGRQEALYGSPKDAAAKWKPHNVIIGPGERHHFFLGQYDREATPTSCFIVMDWQPLGGLSIRRPPLLLRRSREQIEALYRARRSA